MPFYELSRQDRLERESGEKLALPFLDNDHVFQLYTFDPVLSADAAFNRNYHVLFEYGVCASITDVIGGESNERPLVSHANTMADGVVTPRPKRLGNGPGFFGELLDTHTGPDEVDVEAYVLECRRVEKALFGARFPWFAKESA